MKFEIWVFLENLCRIFKFNENLTRITDTLHEYPSIFITKSHSLLLGMRKIPDRLVEKVKTHIVCQITFSRKSYRLWSMWKNIVEPDTPQVGSRRMCITCWITKAKDTHSEYVMLMLFHCSNGRTNAPQCYSLYVHCLSCSVDLRKYSLLNPRVDGPESLHFRSILYTCNCRMLLSREITIIIANNESVKSVR